MSDEKLGRRGNMVARRVLKKDPASDAYVDTDEVRWWFWCPGCEELHTYSTPRWTRTGTDDRPSFTPSLLVTYGELKKRCHLYLTEGMLGFLGDCTHELKGQNVPIPEPPEWLEGEGEVHP